MWYLAVRNNGEKHKLHTMKLHEIESQHPLATFEVDIVVALEDTRHPPSAKQFLTKCASIGTNKPSIKSNFKCFLMMRKTKLLLMILKDTPFPEVY